MLKQVLSKKWIPYEEIGDYLIEKRELKISYIKEKYFIKATSWFVVGILVTTFILIFGR